MSGVSIPVTRPIGRALVVANASFRAQPISVLQRLGYSCAEADDPYLAMMELAKKPSIYRAVILSLSSLYREELSLVDALKRRYPHVEIWLTQTDGRQASLAEAMRFGADGFLAEDGLHRIAMTMSAEPVEVPRQSMLLTKPEPAEIDESQSIYDRDTSGEPVLTADELRALLQEQPSLPPSNEI